MTCVIWRALSPIAACAVGAWVMTPALSVAMSGTASTWAWVETLSVIGGSDRMGTSACTERAPIHDVDSAMIASAASDGFIFLSPLIGPVDAAIVRRGRSCAE